MKVLGCRRSRAWAARYKSHPIGPTPVNAGTPNLIADSIEPGETLQMFTSLNATQCIHTSGLRLTVLPSIR
jgi:hypothetical protein